jgi:hypothetical protein
MYVKNSHGLSLPNIDSSGVILSKSYMIISVIAKLFAIFPLNLLLELRNNALSPIELISSAE